jgi:hypothetical protein
MRAKAMAQLRMLDDHDLLEVACIDPEALSSGLFRLALEEVRRREREQGHSLGSPRDRVALTR